MNIKTNLKKLKQILKATEISEFVAPANVMVGRDCEIDKQTIIGEYTYIGKNCNITKTTIGRYVSIGNNCSIGPGEHDFSLASTSKKIYDSPDWYEKLTEKELTIGNDVWIGADSIIRRGIKVGDGAVIGANSFVNKDIPPFAVVAGNPAKIIKYRFDEDKQKALADSKWWDYEPQKAKEIIKGLGME